MPGVGTSIAAIALILLACSGARAADFSSVTARERLSTDQFAAWHLRGDISVGQTSRLRASVDSRSAAWGPLFDLGLAYVAAPSRDQ